MIASRGNDPSFAILDVRTPDEFGTEHLRNAANIDFNSPHFAEQLGALDTEKAYLVYCGSGVRSAQAAAVMAGHGFTEIYDLKGGLTSLKELDESGGLLVTCGCN
ncbi:MAG: rhodanese-like domain-containing protein [bacterium]